MMKPGKVQKNCFNAMQQIDESTIKTRYYAKLMLFGEYSIIYNSKALTVPFKHFSGELSILNDNKYTVTEYAKNSNAQLQRYAQHLHKKAINNAFNFSIDTQQLIDDTERGLYFESTIPQGYGAGSSGALIAAIYNKYVLKSADKTGDLRKRLAAMENFFHGQSSGIDPLVSFVNKALLVEGDNLQVVQKPNFSPTNKEGLFLIDTQQTSKTEPLVRHFMHQTKNKLIDHHFLQKLNNSVIDSLLNTDYQQFWNLLPKLSEWQLNSMQRMIPEKIVTHWKKGIEQEVCFMKLCGSGGGGYMLAFAPNYERARDFFNYANLTIIPVQTPSDGS
jgi:mevalonate kinase